MGVVLVVVAVAALTLLGVALVGGQGAGACGAPPPGYRTPLISSGDYWAIGGALAFGLPVVYWALGARQVHWRIVRLIAVLPAVFAGVYAGVYLAPFSCG